MRHVLKIVVSLGVLALLIWWADAQVVLEHLRGAVWSWLVLAGISLTALTFLMAKRWQIVAGAVDIEISYARAVAEYYVAQLVNLLLPGGVVGDIARALRVRHAGDMARAAQSVAAERIVGQVVMFATLAAGLSVALLTPGGIAWPMIAWLGIVAFCGGLGILFVLSRRTGALGQFLTLILHLLQHLRLGALSLIITFLLIFSLYACARATGTTIPVSGWFTLIPLILSAMLIPLSVGGWGWREGAAATLFPLIGATPGAGVAMGIAYGAMMMIAALPGLYFVMRPSVSPAPTSDNSMETL